jgi:mannitol/fructose-specific phosphotransferase system IIA component
MFTFRGNCLIGTVIYIPHNTEEQDTEKQLQNVTGVSFCNMKLVSHVLITDKRSSM